MSIIAKNKGWFIIYNFTKITIQFMGLKLFHSLPFLKSPNHKSIIKLESQQYQIIYQLFEHTPKSYSYLNNIIILPI